MKRHGKRKLLWLCLGVLLVALTGLIYWGNTAIEITYYTIADTKIPQCFSGFRIVQISDLHNTEFGQDNHKLLEKIAALQPDIIVLTGDLIDSRNTNFQIAESFAENAAKIAPTYYISGNHEARIGQYPVLEKSLAELGVTILNDTAAELERNGETIHLLGLQDTSLRNEPVSITEIFPEIQEDTYSILLIHDPLDFPTLTDTDIDLVLAGHIHGGQFRLPFLGGLFAPGQGFFPKYDAGSYQINDTQMIISRGLGNSLFPFRLNNRPEIVAVDIKAE